MPSASLRETADVFREIGTAFGPRGWLLATSGNFSRVLEVDPYRLAITRSGVDKSRLGEADVVIVDRNGMVVDGSGPASAETLLHIAVTRSTGTGAVLHTHSPAATFLSLRNVSAGAVALRGYEMLKGLGGVSGHEASLALPVFPNTQNMPWLASKLETYLASDGSCPGFLLAGHGLYAWGPDLTAAQRHMEVFEFLLDVIARDAQAPVPDPRRASHGAATPG